MADYCLPEKGVKKRSGTRYESPTTRTLRRLASSLVHRVRSADLVLVFAKYVLEQAGGSCEWDEDACIESLSLINMLLAVRICFSRTDFVECFGSFLAAVVAGCRVQRGIILVSRQVLTGRFCDSRKIASRQLVVGDHVLGRFESVRTGFILIWGCEAIPRNATELLSELHRFRERPFRNFDGLFVEMLVAALKRTNGEVGLAVLVDQLAKEDYCIDCFVLEQVGVREGEAIV